MGVRAPRTFRQVAASSPRLFSAEDLGRDLDVLWSVLDEGHGGLERYTPRETLKKSFDQAAARLTEPMTELEFYRLLLPLIAEIKDGHTGLMMSPSGRVELLSRPVLFPFEMRFLQGKAYLFRNLSGDRDLRDGAEVLDINGASMSDILARLLPLVPCDAGILSRRVKLLENPQTFGLNMALEFGRTETFRLKIRDAAGGEPREISVAGLTGTDLARIRRERDPAASARRPLYELGYRGRTGVITIRQFGDERGGGAVPFREFIRKTFDELAEKKVETLIIDLRGNGGGTDEYGRLLFAHFMDRPFRYYRALEVKKDRFDLFQYAGTAGPSWPRDGLRKNARGWYDVLSHPNVGTMNPEVPLFSGKTCILIDGLSFSTTGESTSLFHYHRKAVFLGQECGAGYYGNTSGAMPLLTLPKTGLQLRLPLVLYTMAVDGYPKDRGIVPDIEVSPAIEDLLNGRDPVMEKALAYLGGK